MSSIVTVPSPILLAQTRSIVKAWGACDAHADVISAHMHEADLRGIDSHGVGMFPKYDALRRAGGLDMQPCIEVERDSGSTALIDAGHGMGHVPADMAMRLAIDKAKAHGVGVVAVRQSNHFGAAGVYAMLASDQGLIGICTTGTTQRSVVPTFGREPRFSTNPIAFAAPAGTNADFVLDMATSTVAVGKINIARRAGKSLPAGWAVKVDGQPEHDAQAAANATPKRLTPLGGTRELGSHKGYGLAMMVEILSSVMTGSYIGGRDPKTWQAGRYLNVGHFMLALDPGCFAPAGEFSVGLDRLIDMLHATSPVDDACPVLVAGEPERRIRDQRIVEGVPMVPKLIEEVTTVARECGAEVMI